MKKIVNSKPNNEVYANELEEHRGIVAYRSTKSDNVRILALLKIPRQPYGTAPSCAYGFIPLGYIGEPTFIKESWRDAVSNCAKVRELYLFPDMKSLIKAIHNNQI